MRVPCGSSSEAAERAAPFNRGRDRRILIPGEAMITHLYGAVARARRRWYARHPDAVRALARPVISVGNLTVGGAGKTPAVLGLCRWLTSRAEVPSVLSRGYGRRQRPEGVVIVRGTSGIAASLPTAGDEPLMLARALEGARVLVSPDRYLAGRLAELRLGATVHVLDDGFQHLQLRRDIDLLLVDPGDLEDPRTLPAGRLREPIDCAAAAHALVAFTESDDEAARLAGRLRIARFYRGVRTCGSPTLLGSTGAGSALPAGARVLALAGIARPARFFADVRRQGWTIAREISVRDHHPYSAGDIATIERAAIDLRVEAIMTTEKDRVRLEAFLPMTVPIAVLPQTVRIEPEGPFQSWMLERLAMARRSGSGAGASA